MELVILQKVAERHNIPVEYMPLIGANALCIKLGIDDYSIAINIRHKGTTAEEKTNLAHELGHCATSSFYNIQTPILTRGKCERRADEWAIKKLVPRNKLKKAIREGNTEPWQLADYFDVEERLILLALEYYNKAC